MYKVANIENTESLDILIRQVDNIITKDANPTSTNAQTVKYSKLYSLASRGEKSLMIFGWLAAILSGCGMPSFVFIFGNILDAYDPFKNSKKEMMDQIRTLTIAFTCVGAFVWIVSYTYYALLMIFAEKVVQKIRIKYLASILKQESAWFDLNNPSELPSKMTKECQAIRNALGEKMGMVIVGFGMSLSGFVFGLSKGWSFSLVIMAGFPFMIISTSFLMKSTEGGFKKNLKAYGQSAGYAEQALNAIRVVAAFGQELKEKDNYDKYLGQARKEGIKNHLKVSFILAFFMFFMFANYSYSFFMGSVWIYHKIYNDTYKSTYTAGNILTCFFGIFFGMVCLGIVAPNLKSVTEGLVAGRTAFDIIDRQPKIDQDDPKSEKKDVKGHIEFKDVTFVYPSRPEQIVLNKFCATFELGKTTAIVGPSGSGKSTIVQLLERFYDPNDGVVMIDGNDLKSINLRHYRQQVGYVGQEPILFNTSIKQNILLGQPDASNEQIIDSLKKANAYDFIVQQGQSIEMNVGQSGGQLSGGQKQRIAIARAFIKKPKILIFDEATSALDKKNEAEVQNSIDKIREELGEVTTIVIAHRLSTIKNADKILVLKKGKLAEIGNHQSLLKDYPDGVYAKLVQQQQKAEVEEQANGVGDSNQDKDSTLPDIHASKQLYEQGPNEQINLVKAPSLEKQVSRTSMKTQRKQKEEEFTKEADEIVKKENEADQEMKKKLEKANFMKRLSPYTTPKINGCVGVLLSILVGGVYPALGIFIVKALFSLMIPNLEQMRHDTRMWCLWMFIAALILLFGIFLSKFLFGIVGENITLKMRSSLYGAIIKKPISWFDLKENAPGVLTTVLATEAQSINGASTEGLAVMLESFFGLAAGIVLAFFYSWKLSLVAIGCVPFIMCGAVLQAKFQQGVATSDEAEYKDANLLAGDSIINYRTVASFAHDEILVNQYAAFISAPVSKAIKKYHLIAGALGFSQFTQNAVYAVLFWAGAMFMFHDPKTTGEDIFKATFAMMLGASTAAQSNAYGPDMGKAKKAAIKIFSYIDSGSKIDAVDILPEAKTVPQQLQGEIVFKDIWFRYPTRKEWIFKGLNLKIHPNESVAIVGESGSGKSTLVNLLLRFYDPNFGEILVDGINIKEYNLKQLRSKCGLVMQEPILFNYTVRENILYGKSESKNSEIRAATQIANALEFIESDELMKCYDDSATTLHSAFVERKIGIVEKIGNEKYDAQLKQLELFKEKEEKEGKFFSVKGITDSRGNEYLDLDLHNGYDIDCGLKGCKLSGGQKQRIAIARAVIRKPNILILDEATSALDEESQSKVQLALDNIMQGRTSIVIAHRLTTIEKCNRVIVIEDGQVAEEGKFQELKFKKEGYFQKISHEKGQTK